MRFILFLTILLSAPLIWAEKPLCDNTEPNHEDTFPWPWSTQCPFPWESIEGMWNAVNTTERSMYFDFQVVSRGESGHNFLLVTQYNGGEEVLARGIGISRDDRMGVMAAMQYEGTSGNKKGFWLHVSAFDEASASSRRRSRACTKKRVKTAVKMTPFGQKQDTEAPLIIEKLQPREDD